jgi:2-polyprenyl-6-methoxyphenol hydroxylase-like FAD-dependent oxidoreductase
MTNEPRRGVVIGAGMAGLCAARALSESHGEVTIIERDTLASATCADQPRRGVPQGAHIHALLARGQQLLEELFPGLTADLVAGGAAIGDVVGDTRMLLGGHRLRQVRSGLTVVSVSRPFLERHVIVRVRQLTGVRIIDRCDVAGLVTTAQHRRLAGVRIIRRDDHSAEEIVEADTVIDASGRLSRAPVWLERLGLAPPTEDRVVVDLAYASRRYRLGPDALDGDLAIIHGMTPASPRGGAIARRESGTAIVTLAGIGTDRPPIDPDAFVRFAATLTYPDLYDVIRDAEPLDDPVPYRFPASTRRHYEQHRHLPDGFACLGDSFCNVNPVYGQGMTLAAHGADLLRRHLRLHGPLRSRQFHRALARSVEPVWQMATGADLALPGVPGTPTTRQRLLGRYVERLHAAAATDPALTTAFSRVTGLIDPPHALLHPRVIRRVLRPQPER